MTAGQGEIVVFAAHARRVPAASRQRFADELRGKAPAGGLLLETCHRVELYGNVPGADVDGIAGSVPPGGIALRGEAAIRHVITVAMGCDSVVAGEDQVLHQLRQAMEAARARGAIDPALERLLIIALRAGRRARSWREGPARSLADVAVEAIERRIGDLRGRQVLIVGAGRMGGLAARAAAAAGASVAVANRTRQAAGRLAQTVGGHVEPFAPGPDIGRFSAIVVGLAGPWPLDRPGVEALASTPTLVVDLSVPPAVGADLARTLGPRLISADDLVAEHTERPLAADRNAARVEGLIADSAAEFAAWLDGRSRRLAAQALMERADTERQEALDRLWRELPELDPGTRATIEGMSRHLAERLLREPLTRLGTDPDGRHERAVRDLWAL